MEIGVGFDALNKSNKRVKRRSTGNDSVESSAKGNSMNPILQPEASRSTSHSLEKGYSIVAPKRAGNESGKREVIISPDVGNSFPFQRSYMSIKGKEVEGKGKHRQNFPVMGPSISNTSMKRQSNESASSSKKDTKVSSHLDAGLKYRMNGNGIFGVCGLQGKVDEVLPRPSCLYAPRKNTRRAKGMSNENVKKIVYPDLSDGVSSHELKDVQHGEPINLSSRAALFGKEVVTNAEEQGSFESHQNLGLQNAQKFRNNKEKLSSSYLPEWMHETDIEDKGNANVIGKCPRITTQGHISNPHHDQAFPDPVVSQRNHSCKKHAKGKRKCNSSSCNFGETSVSINQASHAGISNLKLEMSNGNGFHGTALIEIDKLYPEARCCNSYGQQSGVFDNSSSRASQIESDEIFARELQEQFYHETTRVIGTDMVDATIACSLQQDEDEHAATLPQEGRSTSELIDEIKWKLEFEADLDKRLDLYEAWEDLLENRDIPENDDPASNHSFNNPAYAMDSSDSDESNHQHVGSSVIDNLPLTLIQNNNDKEACAVCLEIPSVGETMRYLPCLHKFHKVCIDTWLQRKPACPVCKFNIT